MRGERPAVYREPERCVDDTLDRVGRRLVLGTPLGIGKAPHLVNAFYRRAAEDRALDLTVVTALSLTRPTASSELERRLVEPIADTLYGDYPELEYATARRRGALPPNVQVREFYYPPGSLTSNPAAQQGHISTNYSFVVRDLLDLGVNVIAQLVAREEVDGEERYSLSGNPDLTLDLLGPLAAADRPVALLAQVNGDLPFLYGDAMVAPETFHGVLDDRRWEFSLPSTPNVPVSTADYMAGIYASALVRDGGTLQLGIGSLGDAVTRMLQLRHEDNGVWRRVVESCCPGGAFGEAIGRIGGTGPFERGLYGSSEMLTDGFLALRDSGILTRTVYPDAELQRRLDAGELSAAERRDLQDRTDGRLVHAGFFLGPKAFYRHLRELPREERERIEMTAISYTNELFGDDEAVKRAQRRHARFLNSGLKATLLGDVASETLADGRVISGVGGQYNFVAMAHALDEGRSVLMVRAVRDDGGAAESNLVWSYGRTTIPRHLRDLVVTEYGIADLRGRSDAECVAAMLNVADSRFQESLLGEAQRAGKLPRDHEIPECHRDNTPERLERTLRPYREQGLFESLPYGSDLSETEITLARALKGLRGVVEGRKRALLAPSVLARALSPPAAARPYLERMELEAPRTWRERGLQRAVVVALALDGAV